MALLKKNGIDGHEGLTIISEEATFHGVLTVKGSLRVDGSVDGDISDAVSVSVGKTGKVKGNITAETLSVAGQVDGDVLASRSIEVLSDGRLHGDIRTGSLKIEEGALFDGHCAMEKTASEARGVVIDRKAKDIPVSQPIEENA